MATLGDKPHNYISKNTRKILKYKIKNDTCINEGENP